MSTYVLQKGFATISVKESCQSAHLLSPDRLYAVGCSSFSSCYPLKLAMESPKFKAGQDHYATLNCLLGKYITIHRHVKP